MTQRPLSPHLSIYRWLWTNTLSILHRITGVILVAGSVLLVAWLAIAAYWPDYYADVYACLSSWPGRVALFGWTVAFYYHLGNGIRHLLWDTGAGFELHTVYRSAKTVVAFTVIMSVLTWALVWM